MLRCEICHVSCLHSCTIILAVNNDNIMVEGRECHCIRESVHTAYIHRDTRGWNRDELSGMHLLILASLFSTLFVVLLVCHPHFQAGRGSGFCTQPPPATMAEDASPQASPARKPTRNTMQLPQRQPTTKAGQRRPPLQQARPATRRATPCSCRKRRNQAIALLWLE